MTRLYVMLGAGILALVIGFALSFYVNARRFNRRNQMGLELFTSYGAAVGVRLYESMVVIVSRVLIFVGAILIVFDGISILRH
jgi:hypothetical protein